MKDIGYGQGIDMRMMIRQHAVTKAISRFAEGARYYRPRTSDDEEGAEQTCCSGYTGRRGADAASVSFSRECHRTPESMSVRPWSGRPWSRPERRQGFTAVLNNVNKIGAGLHSKETLPIGAKITVSLAFLDPDLVEQQEKLTATVAWAKPWEKGTLLGWCGMIW